MRGVSCVWAETHLALVERLDDLAGKQAEHDDHGNDQHGVQQFRHAAPITL
jgi:hypothetical protein